MQEGFWLLVLLLDPLRIVTVSSSINRSETLRPMDLLQYFSEVKKITSVQPQINILGPYRDRQCVVNSVVSWRCTADSKRCIKKYIFLKYDKIIES